MALKIEKMISGFKALGYEEGKTVIIDGALKGEVIEYKTIKERRGVIEGECTKVLEPSPLRISPICPYYGKCGGCDAGIVNEEDSALIKEEIVKDTFSRIAPNLPMPQFSSPAFCSAEGYRIRSRVHVNLKTKEQGFLAKGSNKLIPITHCPILEEKLNALLSDKGGDIYRRARELMFENRVNRETGFVEVPLFSGDREVSKDNKAVEITVSGIKYLVSAEVFFQSNARLLPSMLSFVKENTVGNSIMDLYSGVGTFSALFNNENKTVYAVERERKCLELSKRNAPNAISFTDDCARWGKKSGRHVDTVIVDPPRVGLDREVVSLLEEWSSERIIYISCNPVTAARDLSMLNSYKAIKAQVFDLYPGSSHVETIVLMSRVEGK